MNLRYDYKGPFERTRELEPAEYSGCHKLGEKRHVLMEVSGSRPFNFRTFLTPSGENVVLPIIY